MIYVPYTNLYEETKDALVTAGLPWTGVDVSGSESNYWDLMHQLWASGETFVIVEHDIVVGGASVQLMLECSHLWCACSYPYFMGPYAGLGCTKFEGSLTQAYPHAMDQVGQMFDEQHPMKHWCRIDHWLWTVLHQVGLGRHVHDGTGVGHMDVQSLSTHGCL